MTTWCGIHSSCIQKHICSVFQKKCYYSLCVDERGLAEMSLRWQHTCTCKHFPLVELWIDFIRLCLVAYSWKLRRNRGDAWAHKSRPKVNDACALRRVLSYLFCSSLASLQGKHEAILRMGFEISTFPTAVCSVFPGIIINRGRTFVISIVIITFH